MRSCWNLKLSEGIASFVAGVFVWVVFSVPSFAQMSEKDTVRLPAGTFIEQYLFPVHPGQSNHLAGTMGELRSTHFHGGIDIRTNNQTGIPIHAAQSGFISRISCTTSGYGNAIYITHPDGNTTVYGHLDKFKDDLAHYVRTEKYKKKTSEINLFFTETQFPVTRGDVIGFSGNTGSSGGAHLHFETRDKNNEVINPLSFGFKEIKDNLPPTAQKIALKTLDIHSRINGAFGRFEFYLQKSGNSYVMPFPIYATGNIGVELLAIDRMDDSHFKFGINYIEMHADSQMVFSQTIDKVNLDETRGILALFDYRAFKMTGNTFNKMFVDDGNLLPYYGNVGNGKICMGEEDLSMKIVLRDFQKNESTVKFTLRPEAESKKVMGLAPLVLPFEYEAMDNTLKVSIKPCLKDSLNTIRVFEKGKDTTVSMSYSDLKRNVYLLDLRKSLPDSIQTCSETIVLNFKDRISSGIEYKYYSDNADVQFSKNSLYDTLFARVMYEYTVDSTELFTISNSTVALFRPALITLKPTRQYADQKNTTVYRKNDNRYTYVGGKWDGDKIQFNTTELGTFTIYQDLIPPTITKMSVTNTSARFRIKDALSGIASFEATIDGQWLLMTYDYKTGIIFSERLDTKKVLRGDFELKVVDNAGNERIFKQKIL
jgi:hypothetical protein